MWADGVVERQQKDEAELKRTFGSGVGVRGCNVDVLNCTSSCMVIVGGAEAKRITVRAIRAGPGEGTGPGSKKAGSCL